MNCIAKEKDLRKKARELADKLLPNFNGLTLDVATNALEFLRQRIDSNFHHNTPLVIKEED